MTNQTLEIKIADGRTLKIKAEKRNDRITFSYTIEDYRQWVSKMTPTSARTKSYVNFAEFRMSEDNAGWFVAETMMANVEEAIANFLRPAYNHYRKMIAQVTGLSKLNAAHEEILIGAYLPTNDNVKIW